MTKLIRLTLCIIVLNILSACTNNRIQTQKKHPSNGAYEVVFEADKDGKTIYGSRQKLIEYINNGNPVRLGWMIGLRHAITKEPINMVHWSDAGFITVIGEHAFAQIRPINQQGPAIRDIPAVFLVDFSPNSWVAIIGTTGVMKQKYKPSNEFTNMMKDAYPDEKERAKKIIEMETKKVSVKWAVLKMPLEH